jgi:hypothetical protein
VRVSKWVPATAKCGDTVASYRYDALGRRIEKIDFAHRHLTLNFVPKEYYYYDGDRVIEVFRTVIEGTQLPGEYVIDDCSQDAANLPPPPPPPPPPSQEKRIAAAAIANGEVRIANVSATGAEGSASTKSGALAEPRPESEPRPSGSGKEDTAWLPARLGSEPSAQADGPGDAISKDATYRLVKDAPRGDVVPEPRPAPLDPKGQGSGSGFPFVPGDPGAPGSPTKDSEHSKSVASGVPAGRLDPSATKLDQTAFAQEGPAEPTELKLYRQFIYGPHYIDEIVAQITPPTTTSSGVPIDSHVRYVLQDANYNVTGLVRACDAKVIRQYRYEPYGQLTAIEGLDTSNTSYPMIEVTDDLLYESFHFARGLRRDIETGLDDARNRDLHIDTGRYLQADPNGQGLVFTSLDYHGSSPTIDADVSVEA